MRGSLPPNMPVGCGCATKERACRVGRTSPPRQRSAVDGGHGRRRARAGDKAECQAGNRRGRGAAHYCLQPRRGRGGVRPRNVAGASDCSMTAACSTSLPAAASLTAASTPERKASSVLLLGLPPDENPRPAEDDDRPVPGFRVSGGAIISKLVTFSHDLPHPRVHHTRMLRRGYPRVPLAGASRTRWRVHSHPHLNSTGCAPPPLADPESHPPGASRLPRPPLARVDSRRARWTRRVPLGAGQWDPMGASAAFVPPSVRAQPLPTEAIAAQKSYDSP